MKTITEANHNHGIAQSYLCEAMGLSKATYYRHKHLIYSPIHSNGGCTLRAVPENALTDFEKQQVLDLLHSERFVDVPPYQVFYSLLDEGQYYCSIRSMYRLLAEQGETKDRRDQRKHKDAIKPELIATAPNQVWSWDITKLKSFQRLVHYHLYVILDIFSRFVVGWLVAEYECQKLARTLIYTSALRQNIPEGQLTLHADNGPSMTSGSVAQLLDYLGIQQSHNRPYTSNDNPFSESQFKTLKYCPQFPEKFETLKAAEDFLKTFFQWYNHEHYHSGIAWLTPYSVHYGDAEKILKHRHATLMKAYEANPIRFNRKPPKQKCLKPAYINPPQTVLINNQFGHLQQEKTMA